MSLIVWSTVICSSLIGWVWRENSVINTNPWVTLPWHSISHNTNIKKYNFNTSYYNTQTMSNIVKHDDMFSFNYREPLYTNIIRLLFDLHRYRNTGTIRHRSPEVCISHVVWTKASAAGPMSWPSPIAARTPRRQKNAEIWPTK